MVRKRISGARAVREHSAGGKRSRAQGSTRSPPPERRGERASDDLRQEGYLEALVDGASLPLDPEEERRARDRSARRQRQRRRRRRRCRRGGAPESLRRRAAPARDEPETALLREEAREAIWRVVEKVLSPMEAKVVVLSIFEDLPASRVAQAVPVSTSAVYKIRRRSFKKLRDYLTRHPEDLEVLRCLLE